MNATRNATRATIVLGALLSAGILLAQAPDTTQAPDANAPQAAQTQPGNFHRNIDPNKMAAHLGKRLGLTGDQVTQITPILADRQQQMQTLRADASLAPKDRRAKARAIRQDANSKIEALLNDTQKQQYEQMLAQRRNHQNRQAQAPQA
jgi:periplasmic protein CpxP/Spy